MKIGHEAVEKVLSSLMDKEKILSLIMEFDDRITEEAKFAHYCDKLECDLQSKIYDEEECVDLNKQENNTTFDDEGVQELLNKGLSWGEMWIAYDQNKIDFDENFLEVSEFALRNRILKLIK